MNQLSITEINTQLQAVTSQTLESIAACTEYGAKLAGWIAYTGLAKAQAKRDLLAKKKETMDSLISVGYKMSPSAFKDYVSSSVADQEYNFELADRTNAAATHQLDLVRSILSALKTEMQSINFYNQ